jgi:hypothetical protein
MGATVIMTDASSESTFIGSESDVRQSEPSVQTDGAVLPMSVDSGDASSDVKVERSAESGISDSAMRDDGLTETSIVVDASPDSFKVCVASECPSCGSGYQPCCKASGCGCVSSIFPQGCY